MLEVKHTPGPWEAIEHPKDWIIKQRVKTASELRFPALIARAERTANARLIAAAPDLLAALFLARPFVIAALADTDDLSDNAEAEVAFRAICDAINKATTA
jgi:hypothetical protein